MVAVPLAAPQVLLYYVKNHIRADRGDARILKSIPKTPDTVERTLSYESRVF
jgi:hypothetical protein